MHFPAIRLISSRPLQFALIGDTTEHSLADSHLLLQRRISQIPDRQPNNPASRAKILMNPPSWVAVKSLFRQDILRFPESRTVFWSNPGSRKHPSGPRLMFSKQHLFNCASHFLEIISSESAFFLRKALFNEVG